jgi:hypothetical protein
MNHNPTPSPSPTSAAPHDRTGPSDITTQKLPQVDRAAVKTESTDSGNLHRIQPEYNDLRELLTQEADWTEQQVARCNEILSQPMSDGGNFIDLRQTLNQQDHLQDEEIEDGWINQPTLFSALLNRKECSDNSSTLSSLLAYMDKHLRVLGELPPWRDKLGEVISSSGDYYLETLVSTPLFEDLTAAHKYLKKWLSGEPLSERLMLTIKRSIAARKNLDVEPKLFELLRPHTQDVAKTLIKNPAFARLKEPLRLEEAFLLRLDLPIGKFHRKVKLIIENGDDKVSVSTGTPLLAEVGKTEDSVLDIAVDNWRQQLIQVLCKSLKELIKPRGQVSADQKEFFLKLAEFLDLQKETRDPSLFYPLPERPGEYGRLLVARPHNGQIIQVDQESVDVLWDGDEATEKLTSENSDLPSFRSFTLSTWIVATRVQRLDNDRYVKSLDPKEMSFDPDKLPNG